MLYGIEASALSGAAPALPTGPYAMSGVTFHSANLVRSSLACTDNQYFGFAGWFKTDWTGFTQIAWAVDPLNNYNSSFGDVATGWASFGIGGNSGNNYLITRTSSTPNSSWHHFIAAGQTNFAAHSKIIKLKMDGVDVTTNINDNATSFNAQSNGLPFYVGSDAGVSVPSFYAGSMADLSIWPGINLLTAGDISSTTIQLFRSASGDPVNPSVSIAALGRPPVFLSGNAASFASNARGSSGSFTISAGSLTDTTFP